MEKFNLNELIYTVVGQPATWEMHNIIECLAFSNDLPLEVAEELRDYNSRAMEFCTFMGDEDLANAFYKLNQKMWDKYAHMPKEYYSKYSSEFR